MIHEPTATPNEDRAALDFLATAWVYGQWGNQEGAVANIVASIRAVCGVGTFPRKPKGVFKGAPVVVGGRHGLSPDVAGKRPGSTCLWLTLQGWIRVIALGADGLLEVTELRQRIATRYGVPQNTMSNIDNFCYSVAITSPQLWYSLMSALSEFGQQIPRPPAGVGKRVLMDWAITADQISGSQDVEELLTLDMVVSDAMRAKIERYSSKNKYLCLSV